MVTKKKTTPRVTHWPTAIVLCVVVVALTLVYVLVPDHRTDIVYAVGVFGTFLLAWMRSLRK